jgi:tubulin---tyrosine ligase
MKKKVKKMKNIWILKPGEITNCGNGIQVASELSEINQIINTEKIYHKV